MTRSVRVAPLHQLRRKEGSNSLTRARSPAKVRVIDAANGKTIDVEIRWGAKTVTLTISNHFNRWRTCLELALHERPPDFASCAALFNIGAWRRDRKRQLKGAELVRREARAKGGKAAAAGDAGGAGGESRV